MRIPITPEEQDKLDEYEASYKHKFYGIHNNKVGNIIAHKSSSVVGAAEYIGAILETVKRLDERNQVKSEAKRANPWLVAELMVILKEAKESADAAAEILQGSQPEDSNSFSEAKILDNDVPRYNREKNKAQDALLQGFGLKSPCGENSGSGARGYQDYWKIIRTMDKLRDRYILDNDGVPPKDAYLIKEVMKIHSVSKSTVKNYWKDFVEAQTQFD